MSFLVGSLAGAVATAGVYYGFSNLIQTRTDQHRTEYVGLFSFERTRPIVPLDRVYLALTVLMELLLLDSLHLLSRRLVDASAMVPGPLPASARIVERPFTMMLQARWNEHVANVFSTVGRWERRTSDWTRRALYGEVSSS